VCGLIVFIEGFHIYDLVCSIKANVGAKAKTLPFARSLRRLATPTKAR
jgi:hypothetical protein